MNKISSKKILLILAAIMFIIVFGRFFSILYFPDSQIILEKGEEFKLQPETSLSQKFISNRDGLSKIELLFRTPGPKLPDVVEVQISDESCSNKIREGILEKSFISSGNLYELKFSEIPDSENKTYCLKATFKPEKSRTKAIKFFTREESNPEFWLEDSANSRKIENQSLSMRTAYKNETIGQDLSELNQRISQYKPFFLKHYYLSTIIILFTLLSAAIVVILIEL